MTKFITTIDYHATVPIEADTEEEAEAKAEGMDITEVLDYVNDGTVIHVEEE
jgi:uncharacterized protein YqfB (UPF0267 family)